ncbi:MAG: ABC transporter substrate-binding protein [Pseudomonadota bacterium]
MPTNIDKLCKDLRAGQLHRRDFMRGALSLGLTVSAATMLADKAAAATPQKGGLFRQGLTGGATSDDLDPATTLDTYMINVNFGQLRNCLTEIAPDGTLIGELAESWEGSADAATWVFKLRRGVEFHNGKTMDSNDVVESINHHRGEETKSAAKGIIAGITDVKADGAETVVITLDSGNADLPYLISDYHLLICPAKAEGGIEWETGVGTGGYMLQDYEPGIRTLTKRNPNYWKEGNAHFDEVETLFIADTTARLAALQTGEVDCINNLELKTIELFKRVPGLRALVTTGNKHCTLPMLTNVAPFDNNELRLALKFAFNREEMLSKIFKGYGELGNDHPIGPANQFRATAEELPQREYDPDKAKFHLQKAGMDGVDLKLHMAETAFNGAIDAGQLYQEAAKKVGINIEVTREPDDGYWSDVWLKKSWSASYWGGRPTEDWIFSQIYSTGADWNETKWDNPQFMDLLAKGRSELDEAKRREIYVEMQRLVRDEGGSVIPVFLSYLAGVSDKVQTPELMGNNWELDGEKCCERWWFA